MIELKNEPSATLVKLRDDEFYPLWRAMSYLTTKNAYRLGLERSAGFKANVDSIPDAGCILDAIDYVMNNIDP